MSKTYKGDVTGNVVELNLLDAIEGTLPNLGTPTVVTKNTGANVVEQIVGDITSSSGFSYDGSVKGFVIGTSCTSIGNNAFNSCTNLTGSLTIPDSVTSIGSGAFSSCTGLTSLIIGDNVTTIESGAFNTCSGLTSLIIGDNVTTIESAAFYYCSSLTGDLIIPDSVTTIGDTNFASAVFAGCAFTNITIGQNVTLIGDWSFGFNSNLTNVNCYVTKTIIDARDRVFFNNSNFTLHVRSSDNTWTAGSGQSIAGASNVNVIKDL